MVDRATALMVDRILICALIAAVIILVVVVGVTASARSKCLRLGYPHSSIDWTLARYCITRIDQTDVVVPLAEAIQRGPRR